MLKLYSTEMELRGVANKVSKQNKTYHVINCETEDGTPYAFYCPDVSSIAPGLKKGDMILITFDVEYFKNSEKLVVSKVVKVEQ